MHGGGPAPFAVLFELDLAHDQFLVLAGPIVDTLALAAGELDKSILGHARDYNLEINNGQLNRDRPGAEAEPQVLPRIDLVN